MSLDETANFDPSCIGIVDHLPSKDEKFLRPHVNAPCWGWVSSQES